MSTTAIERRVENGAGVALFPGSNADEILAVAADVATKFSQIVKDRRMFKRIGESDHIQIEAWQTIGALTGVLAPHGKVTEMPWPHIDPLGEEPTLPGREPRNRDSDEWRVWKRADRIRSAWELHEDMLRARAMGKAYGYVCEFTATKSGQPVGWGENSVDRNEGGWVNKDNHELRAMAETRAQSRALGAPLKFVVKLAGFEPAPAEDLDGAAPAGPNPAQAERIAALERELTAAHEALAKSESAKWTVASDEQEQQAANTVRVIAGPGVTVEAEKFILAMGQHFNGVPEVCVTMLRGLARFIGDARARAGIGGDSPENAPPEKDASAYHQPPPGPPDDVVYPPGHYHGD